MEQNQTPKYATLFYEVKEQLGISWHDYLLLDMVYHLSARTGYCYKTPKSIGEDLGITKQGINKMIARLAARGLLERLTDKTIKVTRVYSDNQYISGNKVSVKGNRWKQNPLSGNKVSESGNLRPPEQGVRITKNNNKESEAANGKPLASNKSLGAEYRRQRKQLGF